MTTRLPLRHRGRAGLIRRLSALEAWREQLPTQAQYKILNVELLSDDLLTKLRPVVELIATNGMEALQPEHHEVLSEVGKFYETLQVQGADIYQPPKAGA
jgi:hypothetical protein